MHSCNVTSRVMRIDHPISAASYPCSVISLVRQRANHDHLIGSTLTCYVQLQEDGRNYWVLHPALLKYQLLLSSTFWNGLEAKKSERSWTYLWCVNLFFSHSVWLQSYSIHEEYSASHLKSPFLIFNNWKHLAVTKLSTYFAPLHLYRLQL